MKAIGFFTFFLFALAFQSTAQSCLSGNCSSGFGKFKYDNGDIYEGEFYDDKREGFGVYTWKSGEKFIGESLGNVFSGFGVMEFADGTKYIGDFKNGEFDGEGEKTSSSGTKQTGIFEKGKYLGKISYYGKAVGTTGCLNGDCYDGYGMKYYSGNDRYFGYFKDSLRNGYGAYYWDDGTRWVGQFERNLLTGYGTYFFITGEKYVGYFVDSKRNGWGINYDPTSGVKKIGFWKDNVLITPKSSMGVDGNTTGCISGDCKNGYGKYVYNNGYYEGYFKNGYRNGQGKYYFDIGDFYTGNFTDNKFAGKGTYYYTNGERYTGEWKDQRTHGKGELVQFDGTLKIGYWHEGKYQDKTTKPPGYDAWVNSNYNSGTTSSNTTASNTNTKPNNTVGNNTNTPTTNKPNTTKPNTPPVTTTNKPNTQPNNTKPNNTTPTNTNTGSATDFLDKVSIKKGLALVIGNSKYTFFGKLSNPGNDVVSVTNALRGSGFDVIVLNDGDRNKMVDKLREFAERLKGYEMGLFYYSGHGVKNGAENYMVPVDANMKNPEDVPLSCLGLSNVLTRMALAGTKMNIVILDACRTPFKEGKGSSDEFDPTPSLNSKSRPDETGIYFATSDGTPASDGVPGTNGIYTGELVKYLKYMCQDIKIEDIFKRVAREVKSKSNKVQVPEANSNITKDFYYQCKQ
ncbi:caspase family protein [Lacibacter sp. H407]|uniref:caspase family protein n=1 Tax=Lacibacter sp. H407 TaxID=3133423 RepID=UPI0030C5A583